MGGMIEVKNQNRKLRTYLEGKRNDVEVVDELDEVDKLDEVDNKGVRWIVIRVMCHKRWGDVETTHVKRRPPLK